MKDEEVAQLLRSDEPVVVIEAPAGCGKTHQAASYAAHICQTLENGRLLTLTHTHAACSVIAKRTKENKVKVDIQTIDGLIYRIASMYAQGLGLPEDVAEWTRENGHNRLAQKTELFLKRNRFVTDHLASVYPIILCDEHQDTSESQDQIVRMLAAAGAKLRVFGDPMQIIPGGVGQDDAVRASQSRWDDVKRRGAFGSLETPHRWLNKNAPLGRWILSVRKMLQAGKSVTLPGKEVSSLKLLTAENVSQHSGRYRLKPNNWNELNRCLDMDRQTLVLSSSRKTNRSFRASFNRRIPIWEGHGRSYVDRLISVMVANNGNSECIADGLIACLQELIVGFSNSAYADRLRKELVAPTDTPRGAKPPHLKKMATMIRENPDHRGVAEAAAYLRSLIRNRAKGFDDIHIELPCELSDLCRLAEADDVSASWAEISRRRSRSHPTPGKKALSTVHKAKGLQ